MHNIDPKWLYWLPPPLVIDPTIAVVGGIAVTGGIICYAVGCGDAFVNTVGSIATWMKDLSNTQDTSGVISDATCPPEQDPDKCKEIQTKIDSAVKRLKRGIRNEKLNKGKKGGTSGHYQNFLDTKVYLKRLIDEAIANGCYID